MFVIVEDDVETQREGDSYRVTSSQLDGLLLRLMDGDGIHEFGDVRACRSVRVEWASCL